VAAQEDAEKQQMGASFVPWSADKRRLAGEKGKLLKVLKDIDKAADGTLGLFPEYLEQKRQAAYLDVFTDAASIPEDYQGTTEDAKKYLDSLARDSDFVRYVPDLAERVAGAKPVWTKAVQDRNENKIELAHAGYVQLYQDYLRTGNPDYMIQAINLRAGWMPVKRSALEKGNHEYSPEGKIKIAGMFDEFPRQDEKKEGDYKLERQLANEFVDYIMNVYDPALGNAPPLNPVGQDGQGRPVDKYGFATRGVPFNEIVYNMSEILKSAGVQSNEAQFKRTLYDVFRERAMETLPVDSDAEKYVETLFGTGNPFRLTEDTEDIEDIVGRDIKDPGFKEELQKINNDIDTACFNALAGIRPGPDARKQLETALTAIGRRYIGETFQLMRDSLNEPRTEQGASLTAGDTEGLAAKIKALEKTGSRDNHGNWIFPQAERETVAAVKQEARKMLEGLTGDGWKTDDSGNTVIARKPGHEVMITGNDRNELVLRERKTGSHRGRTSATGWTDLAVFTYVPDFGDAWVDVRLHTLEQQDEAWSDSDWRAFKQRNEAWENSRLHTLEEPDRFKYLLLNGIDKPAGEIQKKERPEEQPARGRRR
jgi:hypothetical protein